MKNRSLAQPVEELALAGHKIAPATATGNQRVLAQRKP
jgi:hypothetical protein